MTPNEIINTAALAVEEVFDEDTPKFQELIDLLENEDVWDAQVLVAGECLRQIPLETPEREIAAANKYYSRVVRALRLDGKLPRPLEVAESATVEAK